MAVRTVAPLMDSHEELVWLAGLLEGEGSFTVQRRENSPDHNPEPRILLGMVDEDVVRRAAAIMDYRTVFKVRRASMRQDQYRFAVTGRRALDWMTRLRPYMHSRRGARIDEILGEFART